MWGVACACWGSIVTHAGASSSTDAALATLEAFLAAWALARWIIIVWSDAASDALPSCTSHIWQVSCSGGLKLMLNSVSKIVVERWRHWLSIFALTLGYIGTVHLAAYLRSGADVRRYSKSHIVGSLRCVVALLPDAHQTRYEADCDDDLFYIPEPLSVLCHQFALQCGKMNSITNGFVPVDITTCILLLGWIF